jgi:hypothetical protein
LTVPEPVSEVYLRAWSRHTHRSPLYQHLINVTLGNPALMSVIQRISKRPPPNVYLAAIHYLLMDGRSPRLSRYYGSIVEDPLPVSDVDEAFTDFVLENRDDIVELANRRFTQTNECRRCVALLPGVMASPFDRFHLVEIGTSAGINLALDHFKYDFEDTEWGPDSPVRLSAEVRGDPPRLRPIDIGQRVGIDLHLIDRNDPSDRRWLEALIWPEHEERRERLRRALDLTSEMEFKMVEGSVLDELAAVLGDLPPGEPAVVMNSFVLIQLDPDQRERVEDIVEEARRTRPIYRVWLEFIDKDDDWARLRVGSGRELVDLGTAHPHGEWIDLDYSVL